MLYIIIINPTTNVNVINKAKMNVEKTSYFGN